MNHLLVATAAAVLALSSLGVTEKRVVCYYQSWAADNKGDGKCDVGDLEPQLCTHIVYSFVGISKKGKVTVDGDGDESFKKFVALKKRSPGTKLMVSIGGWNEGSVKFSKVVNDDKIRKEFAKNVVDFLKKHKFDGLDVDWEYPTKRGGKKSDKEKFVSLLKDLHKKFQKHGYVLSVAVGSDVGLIGKAYDLAMIAEYVDMINVMSYDMHQADDEDGVVGENAPLYPSSYDKKQGQTSNNVDASIRQFIHSGAPAKKINLGMGFYGRSYTLKHPKNTEVGSPSKGSGKKGKISQEAGLLGYNEICNNIRTNGWSDHWDDSQKVPYAFKDDQWVGYDNVKSIGLKSDYIMKNDIGGAMIWSIDTDDFRGTCGGGKFPLLKEINHNLRG